MESRNQNKELLADLNALVEINNDRVEGYKTALKESSHEDLKGLFKEMAEHSFKFKNELANEVLRLGGELTTSTKATGKLYRAWMDIRAALSGKERHTILSSCEYGEDVALKTYEEVLNKGHFPPTVSYMVLKQKQILQQDHNNIKALRDSDKPQGTK